MELSKVGNQISDAVMNTAANAGVGYLAVWAFTSINPVVGAVFGAAYGFASAALDPVFNAKNSTLPSQILGTALKITLSAQVVMLLLGAALSLKTILAVSFAVLVVAPIVAKVIAVAAGIVGGLAAIALQPRTI